MAKIDPQVLKTYMECGFNVLLEGPHGVGKTQMLTQAVVELGWKVKYFSASTLDPFTDLVGIPVPTERVDVELGTYQDLVNIRPHEIDHVEVIFFDELNRAEPKTLNALMEIIQFGRINGEKLKNLKAVVGAMNPPEDDYQVNALDPALVDRFMFTIQVDANPDRGYLREALTNHVSAVTGSAFGKDRGYAAADALIEWTKGHKAAKDSKHSEYISPRKIEAIGTMYLTLQDANQSGARIKNALLHAMPPGTTWNYGELFALLGGDESLNPENNDYPFEEADSAFLRNHADANTVIEWILANQGEKANSVIDKIKSTPPQKFIPKWGKLFNHMSEEQLAIFFDGSNDTRMDMFKFSVNNAPYDTGITDEAKKRVHDWVENNKKEK